MRNFSELTEREILALAIGSEEEDARIYTDIAEGLRETYPGSAQVFTDMVAEENEHRRQLVEPPRFQLHRLRQGTHGIEAEAVHEHTADLLMEQNVPKSVREEEDEAERRMFVLRVIQPGLAGLMDGSVSTLAPIFAAAFATGRSWDAFLVGLAASIGAGISMGFAEALSDNGSLTGRGSPWIRGVVCGLMTTLGGIGHTLPFLIPVFWTATAIAIGVVVVELAIISWIRWRYMDTPPFSAAVQVMFGGALVFATGILIGNS